MRGKARAAVAATTLLMSSWLVVPPAGADGAFALGDSITVAAQSRLEQAGYTVDAVTGRSFADGLAVLRGLGKELPSKVLVNLGTNSGVTASQCSELTSLVGPDRDLTLVTVNIPVAPELAARSNEVLKRCAASAGARLVDWATFSAANPQVLCPDGIHIVCGGVAAYTELVLAGDAAVPPAKAAAVGGSKSGASQRAAAAAAKAAAEAEAARVAAEAEAARVAAEAEAARVAAEAEAARIAAQEWARTLQVLQTRRAPSAAQVDRRVSPESYRFVSLGERLSAAASS